MNSEACFILTLTHIILAQSMVAHSIHAMILYLGILNMWLHVSQKLALGVTVRDDGSVAGEGRVAGVPQFHSWGKCTMPLTNINSDWISNASSGL